MLRVLLCGCFLLFSAAAFSQQADLNERVKLSMNKAPLSRLLNALDKQSHFTFSFITEDFDKIIIPEFKADNITLSEALEILRTKAGIEFNVSGSTILFRKAAASNNPATPVNKKKVSGQVITLDKEPVPGVTVWVKGTTQRAITDGDGKYQIEVDENTVLHFSSVGFDNQELTVGSSDNLDVVLTNNRQSLNEVVVLGYGTAKKADLSAAVSVVPDMQQIRSRPVLNVPAMIQGKVAGVTVVNNGGHPNSTPQVTIRGVGSRGTESVLYVVDGVPNAPYNPADVESITVLKDAASAAIYGAFSGSAGVILITTRQAHQGAPSVEYSGFAGAKTAWRTPQSLTAEEQARIANLAYTNAGLAPLSGWDKALNPYAQVTRTDWMDQIFRTGMIQRHTVSVNAGTEKFSTLLQARYENEDGTLINTYNKNLSLRANAIYQFNDKVKLRQELFWNNNDNRGAETSSGYSGAILSAMYMPRSATVYYEDGSFGGVGPKESQYLGIHGDAINPVATLLRNNPFNKSSDLQSVTELNITDIVKGLSFLTRYAYRQNSNLWKKFEPMRTEPGKPNTQNSLNYSTGRGYSWIWENTATYNRVFNKHSLGAMVSMTSQEGGSRSFSMSGQTFQTEADWAQFFINAGKFQDRPADDEWKDRNLSYVGRLSYSWANRYFVTGSYRYDIAGRLADGYRGNGFPGVTAAWKLSSEPFFKVHGIDLVKIRGSWGVIGNINSVGLYYGYPKLSSNTTFQVGDGSPLTTALYVNSRNNPKLTWEKSRQSDIGIDLAFLQERLSITADYFDKLTYDLIKLQDTGWPNTFGFGAPQINQGEIRNTGLEIAASWHDRAGMLNYEIGGNVATLKNRVAYIDGNPTSFWSHGDSFRGVLTPYRSVVGQPYYSYWLIRTAGIFQTDAEAAAYVKDGTRIQPQAKAGDLKFVDKDNNGKIDDGDREYMGSSFPKLTYGFTANLSWKNWDLSLFLQGVGGVKLFNAFKLTTLSGAEQGYNRWDKILDAWSPTNTGADIPRISANDPNKNFQSPSDFYLENGNYLRVKNLLIGYTFRKMSWNSGLRVYVSGDNLLTFTKYSGMDPEVGGIGLDGGQFPLSRIYSVGLKLNL